MCCHKCRNEIIDKKGIESCKCMEFMTQAQYDRFFGDQLKGCPWYFEKQKIKIKKIAV